MIMAITVIENPLPTIVNFIKYISTTKFIFIPKIFLL
jgi:hypothetical protein